MNKIKLIIKIGIEFLSLIFIYMLICMLWNDIGNLYWIYLIITILLIIYENIVDIKYNFLNDKSDKTDLFNTYYVNYPKVFEIAMLINNRIKIKAEESYKQESQNKESYNIEGAINLDKIKLGSKLGNELIKLSNHEYTEFQEIKNTNSIYLREVLKKCKNIKCLDNLKNGDLVKINNVQLNIINNNEILQANSIISGAFNGNTLDTYSNGQAFKININSLTNMVLKDYKYCLIGKKDNKSFYIDIPMKAEKEFENEYSIYDLEIGLVNIVGIFRTNKYHTKNKTTFDKLQEIGNEQNINIDEMQSSRKKNDNDNKKLELIEAPYIDLIAIIQDLSFEEKDNG